jgi:hypothetical protein
MDIFKSVTRLRHTILDDVLFSEYNPETKMISCDGKTFTTLSAFGSYHYKKLCPDKKREVNGWKECECQIKQNDWLIWISCHEYRKDIIQS